MVATSADASRTPGRFVALDSLRGLAALCIVYYHIGDFGWIAGLRPFRHGWMLVDFFFVLSGFVIAASYGARLAEGYPRGRFLLVRLGRVYPLHIVTVALYVALEFLVFRPVLEEPHSLTALVRGVFLLDAFIRGAGNFFAPVSWAIAVEMVAYALAAVLFALELVLVLGIGLALSVCNVYFRDVQYLLTIGLQLLFYATPVIYPMSLLEDNDVSERVLGLFNLNPMTRLMDYWRAVLYDLRFPAWGDVAYVAGFAGVGWFWSTKKRTRRGWVHPQRVDGAQERT